jgi:entericidin A
VQRVDGLEVSGSQDGQREHSAGTRSLFFSQADILNALASMGRHNGTFVAKGRSLKRRAVRSRRGRKTMKRLLTIFVLGSSMLALSACNTVEGAGKDVESVGDCADGVKGNC